jgi:hypothetical protein
MENWKDRISVNPAVCHGKACIRGTRVLVSVGPINALAFADRQTLASESALPAA